MPNVDSTSLHVPLLLLSPVEQAKWLAATPTDRIGDEVRPDRPQQRRADRARFRRLTADPSFAALLPAVRRYIARTIPAPRRTEFSRWSVSIPPLGMMAVSAHGTDLLTVDTPSDIAVLVDLGTLLRRWDSVEHLTERYGFVRARAAGQPGVLRLDVSEARDLMRLLDVEGVVAAARRLNLKLLCAGLAVKRRSHSFALADLLLDPVEDPIEGIGDPFALASALDERGDLAAAEVYYCSAVVAGHPDAAFRLGALHLQQGNERLAGHWFRRAEETGDDVARAAGHTDAHLEFDAFLRQVGAR